MHRIKYNGMEIAINISNVKSIRKEGTTGLDITMKKYCGNTGILIYFYDRNKRDYEYTLLQLAIDVRKELCGS